MSELQNDEQQTPPPGTPEPEVRERRRPGRKPGQGANAPRPPDAGPIRTVSLNPRPSGMTLVSVQMELPLALAIKLASAAADIQNDAEAEPVRVGAFPKVNGREP